MPLIKTLYGEVVEVPFRNFSLTNLSKAFKFYTVRQDDFLTEADREWVLRISRFTDHQLSNTADRSEVSFNGKSPSAQLWFRFQPWLPEFFRNETNLQHPNRQLPADTRKLTDLAKQNSV